MPARLTRVIAVAVALAIVVGTGVAWGKIRSFESGINHISPIALNHPFGSVGYRIDGDDAVKSTIDTSSINVGRRQSA